MKTNSLFKTIALIAIISLASCSKDSSSSTADSKLTSADAMANSKMDQASNDISDVVEEQEGKTYVDASAGKTADTANSLVTSCAHITRVPDFGTAPTVGQTVTKTIDFSFNNPSGCTFANGSTLKGKIIISFVYDPNATSHTVNYSFDNFYHNGNHVEGNRSITRSIGTSPLLTAPHPIHAMTIDMTVTFENGGVYHRVGTRTRECVANFGNNNVNDNVYKLYQSITTTRPNGASHIYSVVVATPLTIDMACQYRVISGILTVTGPLHSAVIDYGSGTCDNNATIAIDGGTPTAFTFGN